MKQFYSKKMPNITFTVAHNLMRDEAVERIKGLWDDIKEKHGEYINDLNESWDNNTGRFSFKMMGFPVKGTLTVQSEQVFLDGTIPLLAMPFKGQIEEAIQVKARELLR